MAGELNYHEVLDYIRTNSNINFFIGAGISKRSPSNLMDSFSFKKWFIQAILNDLKLDVSDESIGKFCNYSQEQIMQWMVETLGRESLEILRIFDTKIYNRNHAIVALFLNLNIVNKVFTTNFDILIEEAHREIINTELATAFETQDFTNDNLNLLKIHGTLESLLGSTATLADVSRPLPFEKEDTIKKSLSEGIMIVLGYSGSDPDIRWTFSSSNSKNIIWLICPDMHNLQLQELITELGCKWFEMDIDQFFDQLAKDLKLREISIPLKKPNPMLVENVYASWREKYKPYGLSLLCGNYANHTGNYTLARESLASGLKSIDSLSIPHHWPPDIQEIPNWQDILQGLFLGSIGMVEMETGHFNNSLEYFKKSLEACEKVIESRIGIEGTYPTLISSLANISELHRRMGNYEKAKNVAYHGLEIGRKIGHPSTLIQMLGNIALLHQNLSEFDVAMERIDEALTLIELNPDLSKKADLLHTKGSILHQKSMFREAFSFYTQSLEILKMYPDPLRIFGVLRDIGISLFELKRPKDSLYYLLQALDMLHTLNLDDTDVAAQVMMNIGLCNRHITKGQYPLCQLKWYGKAIHVCLRGDFRLILSQTYANLGISFIDYGDDKAAIRYFYKCMALCEDMGDWPSFAQASVMLSNYLISTNKATIAWNLSGHCKDIAERTGSTICADAATIILKNVNDSLLFESLLFKSKWMIDNYLP